jgi:ABC-type nitrate/sulfonate/bicarbonate transport system substrate-binding protein
LAQKRGFLKEEGLDAEIIRITGAASRAALSSGEVDYGTGLGSNIGLAMTGLPIKVVACYVPAPVLALVSRAEVKTVQALRGKTVGILVFGGVAHFAARTIAKHFGVDPEKELKFIAVGAVEARFAALTQGLIDAALLAPPLDAEAKKRGFNILAGADEILKSNSRDFVVTRRVYVTLLKLSFRPAAFARSPLIVRRAHHERKEYRYNSMD